MSSGQRKSRTTGDVYRRKRYGVLCVTQRILSSYYQDCSSVYPRRDMFLQTKIGDPSPLLKTPLLPPMWL